MDTSTPKPEQDPESSGEADAAMAAEVEAVLAEFGGDARAAIAALLHNLGHLAADYAGNVSRGFVRGRTLSQGRG